MEIRLLGFNVFILWSAMGLIQRTFATVVGNSARQESLSWLQAKQNYRVTPLSSGDMATVASLSNPAHFRRLLQPLLAPRISGTPENLAVQDYITGIFSQLGYTIELDSFVDFPPSPFFRVNFTNIVATLNSSAPRKLVLACHFDSKFMEGVAFSGATDSAVPCAMMLDVAVTLDALLKKPRMKNQEITLQFIFFDGEEAFGEWSATDSLYGSRHLAEKLATRQHPSAPEMSDLAGIDLFVLMDLIGGPGVTFRNFFPDTSHHFQRFGAIESTLATTGHLQRTARTERTERTEPTERIGRTERSEPYFPSGFVPNFFRVEDDHVPFQKRGVPILHLISVPFPGVWHTPFDDEAHLDFASIEDLTAILRVFVCEYLACPL